MAIFDNLFIKNKAQTTPIISAEYDREKNIWIPILTTQREIIPRHDAMLSFNASGDLAIFVLPTLHLRTVQGIFFQKTSKSSLVALCRMIQGKFDNTYIVPFECNDAQERHIQNIFRKHMHGNIFDKHLSGELRAAAWRKFVVKLINDNMNSIDDPSMKTLLKRVFSTTNPSEPDITTTLFKNSQDQVPIYIYTSKQNSIILDKELLRREIIIRRMIAEERYADLVKTEMVKQWDNDPALIEVISRAEAELTLKFEPFWKRASKLMLDRQKFDCRVDTPPYMFVRPKGEGEWDQISKQKQQMSGCVVSSWDGTDSFFIIFNLGEQSSWLTDECVKSPGIMIFKDNYGINTMQAYLFVVPISSFAIQDIQGIPNNLDDLPASAIPKINMRSLSAETPGFWWNKDDNALKIFWLACQNLCSHTDLNSSTVIISLTTIANTALLSIITNVECDIGTPNGFLIVKDETEINAIPVYPKNYIELQKDGRVTCKQSMFIKNYTITNDGRRKHYPGTLKQIFGSIYSAALQGVPETTYATKNVIEARKQKNFINDKFNLALGLWKMPAGTKGSNCYGILTFIDGTIEIIAVVMEPKISNAKEAIDQIFGLKAASLLDYEMQPTTINENWQSDKNKNSKVKELPWSSVIPDKKAKDICLCHKRMGGQLNIGVLINKNEPLLVNIEMGEKECSQIASAIGDVCRGYLSTTPLPENYIYILNELIQNIRYYNQGQTPGRSGKLLHI
jgi:hypothetical protein